MAETEKTLERTYVVPLRKEWLKAAHYKRANKAVKALKQFIAKHMKVIDRDIRNVKLDKWVNQELWFRGIKKPLAKIKVIAKKEGEIVNVKLAEEPEYVKFKRMKEEKLERASEAGVKKAELKEEKKETAEEKKEEKAEMKNEEEKKSATVEAGQEIAKQQAHQMKHTAVERQSIKDIAGSTRRATKGR